MEFSGRDILQAFFGLNVLDFKKDKWEIDLASVFGSFDENEEQLLKAENVGIAIRNLITPTTDNPFEISIEDLKRLLPVFVEKTKRAKQTKTIETNGKNVQNTSGAYSNVLIIDDKVYSFLKSFEPGDDRFEFRRDRVYALLGVYYTVLARNALKSYHEKCPNFIMKILKVYQNYEVQKYPNLNFKNSGYCIEMTNHGENLKNYLKGNNKIEMYDIIQQLMCIFYVLHEKLGMIHGDAKPNNIAIKERQPCTFRLSGILPGNREIKPTFKYSLYLLDMDYTCIYDKQQTFVPSAAPFWCNSYSQDPLLFLGSLWYDSIRKPEEYTFPIELDYMHKAFKKLFFIFVYYKRNLRSNFREFLYKVFRKKQDSKSFGFLNMEKNHVDYIIQLETAFESKNLVRLVFEIEIK